MELISLTVHTPRKGEWTPRPLLVSLRKVTLTCYYVMPSAVPISPLPILTKTLWVGDHQSSFTEKTEEGLEEIIY